MKSARDRNLKTTLFIGAGCSVTAGIPLASGIVQQIHDRFGREYELARQACVNDDLLYQACMAELDPGQRHDLFRDHIENAQINWAHIAIACLIKHD